MYVEERVSDGPRDSATPTGPVRFSVLGPLEILRDGVDYAPRAPKILQLLAMLVLNPGKMVHLDTIVRELWADDPPRSARSTLHTYIYHLRRCIEQNRLADNPEAMLTTRPPGYVFHIDPAQVDLIDFQRQQQHGTELQRAGRHADAALAYRAALDLWAGAPLANVHCGPVLTAYVAELQEQRHSLLHLWIEAEITSGRHRELIGELRSLAALSPLDEALHGQLMRALGRSGRRSDAMAVYRMLRKRLAGDLGVEPCEELQLLHHHLLSEGNHRRPVARPPGHQTRHRPEK
jgi:DNA-binding SARP family transcriptional activator